VVVHFVFLVVQLCLHKYWLSVQLSFIHVSVSRGCSGRVTMSTDSELDEQQLPTSFGVSTAGMMGENGAGLPPPWLLGGIEAPAGEKQIGRGTFSIYTPEQQHRLGVDETGNTAPAPTPAPAAEATTQVKVKGAGPAWTRGEMEPPTEETDMGGWFVALYSAEQRARLGVDVKGNVVTMSTTTAHHPLLRIRALAEAEAAEAAHQAVAVQLAAVDDQAAVAAARTQHLAEGDAARQVAEARATVTTAAAP
jgi:hypothetical protein